MDESFSTIEHIIIALMRKAASAGLTKMRLIKLVFFTDLESVRQDNEMLTDCQYRTDQFGIVDYKIWDLAQNLNHDENINFSVESNYYGSPSFYISLIKDEYPETPDRIKKIVDSVWDKFGKLTATGLGIETKQLVPMDDEWETGVPIDPRDLVFEESDEFKSNLEAYKNYPHDYTEIQPISG